VASTETWFYFKTMHQVSWWQSGDDDPLAVKT